MVTQYERITLNGFTTCYTLATVLSCIVLVALQALTYVDNTQAIDRFTPVLRGPNIPSGIPIKLGDTMLHICPSLYANTAESCRLVVDFTKNAQRQVAGPGSVSRSFSTCSSSDSMDYSYQRVVSYLSCILTTCPSH